MFTKALVKTDIRIKLSILEKANIHSQAKQYRKLKYIMHILASQTLYKGKEA